MLSPVSRIMETGTELAKTERPMDAAYLGGSLVALMMMPMTAMIMKERGQGCGIMMLRMKPRR